MRGSLHAAIAAAWTTAFLLPALPAIADEVSCEGFVLGYDGDAKDRVCKIENSSSRDGEYETKSIDVTDQTFGLWVGYYHTIDDTIIHQLTVDRWLAKTHAFTHVQKLGVSRHLGAFEVVAFTGVAEDTNYESTCALFSLYFGRANSYGPGVFRNLILGLYCAEPGFLTPEQEKSGFYDVVEQVIAKLRLPPTNQ